MTLLELLMAMSIIVMVVGTLGTLARGIQQGFEYTEGHGTMTQHARVALDRITRTVREATANERFPGVLVVADTVGSWRFPDTLAVWHPDAAVLAAHPERLPLTDPNRKPYYDELVIYCPCLPDPRKPAWLVEITDPRDIALGDNEASWPAEIDAIRELCSDPSEDQTGNRTVLTKLMRKSSVFDANVNDLSVRGVVRFETMLRPSEDEWDQYQSIAAAEPANEPNAWKALPWVQGIYGSQTGLRQVWMRVELQLMPGEEWQAADSAGQQAVPFLDSAALYYELHRK